MKTRLSSFISLVVLIVAALTAAPAAAQGSETDGISVCRDPRYGTVRIEFRGIPQEWIDSEGPSWWALADGIGFYPSTEHYPNTVVADALTSYGVYGEGNPDWLQQVKAGDALVGSGDYSVIVKGNADSPTCDVTTSPVQDEGYVYPEPTPEPKAETLNCPFIQMYPEPYCYTPQANGIIPIPPPTT